MNTDIYSSLTKTLSMPNLEDISCYPVRASAVGAIAALLEVRMVLFSFSVWPYRFGLFLDYIISVIFITCYFCRMITFLLIGNLFCKF